MPSAHPTSFAPIMYARNNPCSVFLALDLRGDPTAIDDDTKDVDLYMGHRDPMRSTSASGRSMGFVPQPLSR